MTGCRRGSSIGALWRDRPDVFAVAASARFVGVQPLHEGLSPEASVAVGTFWNAERGICTQCAVFVGVVFEFEGVEFDHVPS